MTLPRIIGAALAVAALLPATASAHSRGAVFVQTDNPAGNTVVAYDRNPDGSLQRAGSFATGGRGGVLDGSVVDHLASQGSLTYDRANGLLYAVNAGSDTLTVFGVDGDRLMRRQVVPDVRRLPGQRRRPRQPRLRRSTPAAAGRSRATSASAGFLVPVPLWHRALGLDPQAAPGVHPHARDRSRSPRTATS